MDAKYWSTLWQRCQYAVLLLLFFTAACVQKVDEGNSPPAETPVTESSIVPLGVLTAHEAALEHISSLYETVLPSSGTNWSVYNATPVNVIGTTTYRFKSANCTVTISYPLTAPESTVYHVVLDDSAAELYWEGDVDAQGEVVVPMVLGGETAVFDSINIVNVANLRSTTQIEICDLDWVCYTPLLTINDIKIITTLVDALDTDLPLVPHAQCPAAYQIRFVLADGEHHTFGYTCEMKTPVFLRGSQDFWQGQDGIAPDAFNEILLSLITPVSEE